MDHFDVYPGLVAKQIYRFFFMDANHCYINGAIVFLFFNLCFFNCSFQQVNLYRTAEAWHFVKAFRSLFAARAGTQCLRLWMPTERAGIWGSICCKNCWNLVLSGAVPDSPWPWTAQLKWKSRSIRHSQLPAAAAQGHLQMGYCKLAWCGRTRAYAAWILDAVALDAVILRT